jgi:hypothetical protein
LVTKILAEGPIGMSAAAGLMGKYRDSKPTHPSTITRWAAKGVRIAGGRAIRLETIKVNGRLLTSRAAIVRFIAAQQDPPPTAVTQSPARAETPARRRQAAARASSELDALLGGR